MSLDGARCRDRTCDIRLVRANQKATALTDQWLVDSEPCQNPSIQGVASTNVAHWFLASILLLLAACGGAQSDPISPIQGSPVQPAAPAPQIVQHIITYGQSLSLGERAVNAFPNDLTLPGGYRDVGMMFVGGTRPSDLSALVTFAESTTAGSQDDWNIGTPGETPLYGALLTIKDLPGMHIGSAAGRGGTPIVDLSRGTAPYQRLLAQVTAGQKLSKGTNTVSIIWMQGESDTGNTNYASEFEQLVMDLDADVRAITHQGPVQFYVCLPAVPEIAAAQQSVAAAMAQVHIACDTADLDHSDGLHLTALSSRQAGGMLGNAILHSAAY